ncbi:hypothetical protein Trydic_g9784 [Trypoxylus dichotomus]
MDLLKDWRQEDELPLSNIQNSWTTLQTSGHINSNITLKDYLIIDEDISATEYNVTDEDILKTVTYNQGVDIATNNDDGQGDSDEPLNTRSKQRHERVVIREVLLSGETIAELCPPNKEFTTTAYDSNGTPVDERKNMERGIKVYRGITSLKDYTRVSLVVLANSQEYSFSQRCKEEDIIIGKYCICECSNDSNLKKK